jgi:Bardet-Biedl syndrome 1 protein
VAVALTGGTVNFYSGCQVMDTIAAPDTVSALVFGRFGQEDHSLVLVTISKNLIFSLYRKHVAGNFYSSNYAVSFNSVKH